VKVCLPKSKVKVNGLNLSDKVKILDLLEGGRSSVEEGDIMDKMNEVHCTLLDFVHPKHLWVFLNRSLLRTTQRVRVYCIAISYNEK
jgi:hypothetical protein